MAHPRAFALVFGVLSLTVIGFLVGFRVDLRGSFGPSVRFSGLWKVFVLDSVVSPLGLVGPVLVTGLLVSAPVG